MSECVVRMEMPHDGLCDLEQTLIYGLSTYCAVNGGRCNYSDTGTRPDYCPIICSLPEGHGDLIDRDSMVEEWVDEKIGNPHADYEADDVIYDLKKRTVIVPKDKAYEP